MLIRAPGDNSVADLSFRTGTNFKRHISIFNHLLQTKRERFVVRYFPSAWTALKSSHSLYKILTAKKATRGHKCNSDTNLKAYFTQSLFQTMQFKGLNKTKPELSGQ